MKSGSESKTLTRLANLMAYTQTKYFEHWMPSQLHSETPKAKSIDV